MTLKVFMIIYLIVLLTTAYYLWYNRTDHFLIFNRKNNANFRSIMSWTAVILFLESVIGFFILLLGNRYLNLITLILSSVTIFIFSILINQKDY
ncbi:hypothetical protein [Lactobacillus xylocopicola]|uniref:Uncharacterized protein n=1 Tax=Lactobacillus xylocopicola TaxID=2976676 RepID=A0ABM8BGK4_9LACO|nr:hypothetical protein [Lactobacillus xylocopicola]BDR60376.1 hypothetical protein KIM322_06370 [Lactobacillus xylocopicola]